jgi:DNA polymerase III delta subunit
MDALVKQLLGDAWTNEYAVVPVDAGSTEPAGLLLHLTGMSLMAAERVIIIRDVDEWTASQQRELLQILRTLPSGISVILTVVGEGSYRRQPLQADLMTFLESHGRIERRAKLRQPDIIRWVKSLAQTLGVNADDKALEELVLRVGADQDRLANEIEKLATYVGEGERITLDTVRQLVPRTAEGSVFALVDAIGDGETRRACFLVREFLPASGEDEAVSHLMHMLARHFRLLWQTLVLARAGYRLEDLSEVPEEFVGKFPTDPNVVAVVGGRDWMARKLSQQAQHYTEMTIIRCLREIYVADITLKGIVDRRLPPDVLAELLVSQLCRLRTKAGVF